MHKPYIGITGFMTQEDIDQVLQSMPENPSHLLMVGVLASSKTVQGIPNKWPKRYPHVDKIPAILSPDPRALNLIHYNTDCREDLRLQLLRLTLAHGGIHLHGLQLNIAWPDPQELLYYRLLFPHQRIVLQIGRRAFEMVEDSPKKLVEMVRRYIRYGITIDDVLLDPSGGLGKQLDPDELRPYLEALTQSSLGIGLGIAGGLSATTLDSIVPLVKDFPNLSIDAEGRLRDAHDNLHIASAKNYVIKALEIFS